MSTSLTLYEISDTLTALLDTLDMCETPEQRAACESEIVATVGLQVRKVDDFCRFLAHAESQIVLAGEEIERLKTRKAALASTVERLEGYAVHVMQVQDVTKLDGETSRLSLRTNQPAVEITDEAAVPGSFKTVRQAVSVDKVAIRKALQAGREVPGADLRFGTVSLVRK